MKNNGKLFSIVILLVLIVVLMMACGNGSSGSIDSIGFNEEDIPTDGLLTINGLDNYIGIEIDTAIWLGEYSLLAFERAVVFDNNRYGFYSAIITSPSITLKVYKESTYGVLYSYNGNDQDITFIISIAVLKDGTLTRLIDGSVTVDFINGIGEGNFIPNSN